MNDIITVDAGHSGAHYNKGAVPGYYESAIMWDLHLRFAEALQDYGPAICLTRTTLDADPDVVVRGKKAEGSRAVISFHSNAETTGKADYPMGIYIATGGRIQRYPKFDPEDHVLLKLTPSKWEDKWYQWNQEVPANASPESKAQAREFSELKVGYRGDLRFSKAEILDLKQIMGIQPEQKQEESLQTIKM